MEILSSPSLPRHPSLLPSISMAACHRNVSPRRVWKGELAALHSLGLAENNSTGCPALRSVHRRSSDVNHVRVHSLLHISLTPTRPLLASFPRCLKLVACCTLVPEMLEKKKKTFVFEESVLFQEGSHRETLSEKAEEGRRAFLILSEMKIWIICFKWISNHCL